MSADRFTRHVDDGGVLGVHRKVAKYQLKVYWKDGNASGRVIELDWPLSQPLTNIKRVELGRAPKVVRGKTPDAMTDVSER